MNEYSFMSATALLHAPVEGDKRRAILDSAMTLFAELGFHGTTIPEVAERARVAAGTIYRYFDSKEALVNAVFRREKEALASALLEDFPWEAGPREQFHAFWLRYAKHATEHREAFAFLELHHHAPYLDDESRAVEASVLMAGKALIESAQQQGAMKPLPPALLIAIVYGSFATMIKASFTEYLELSDEIVDAAERCVWEAIRA
jgi:TetR/AcrR family transcriptional regulator, repressor of fatR-cypB operon